FTSPSCRSGGKSISPVAASQTRAAVGAGRGHVVAVRAEGRLAYPDQCLQTAFRLVPQGRHEPARVHVPDPGGPVVASRHGAASLGVELGVRDLALVRPKVDELRTICKTAAMR